MPEGFDFPTKWDLWIPLAQTAELKREDDSYSIPCGRALPMA